MASEVSRRSLYRPLPFTKLLRLQRAPADLAGNVARGFDLPSLRESLRSFHSPLLAWHGCYGEDRVYRVRLPFKDSEGGREHRAIRGASGFD